MADLVALLTVKQEAVEQLLDDAFGADRFGRTAYLLRACAKPIAQLSFGLVDQQSLLGSIQCWPVRIHQTAIVLVGPVAVSPTMQGTGLGHRLMHATLHAAGELGDPPMVMIGDPEYYGRFGFTNDSTSGWTLPGPWEARRLLARNAGKHILPTQGMLERNSDAL
jgi:predicted N-acetyltransferase YhbS